MGQAIPASQLILNDEGAVYHLNLHPDQIADDIILVGDPGRVATVSSFFDRVEVARQNRELVTRTGYFKGKRVTVLSTGMGTDNIDIVVNELDALANIDLQTRMPKETHKTLNLIRLGTSGALQPDIPVGDSYVAARYALGFDGLLYFYDKSKDIIDADMLDAFVRYMDYPADLPKPYVVEGSKTLFDRLAYGYCQGVTATAPGFYGPQGRSLRLSLAFPEINKKMERFRHGDWRICNFEMESSALYGLGKMLGHNCLTLCVVVANRVSEKFASDYHPYVEKLVLNTLERISK